MRRPAVRLRTCGAGSRKGLETLHRRSRGFHCDALTSATASDRQPRHRPSGARHPSSSRPPCHVREEPESGDLVIIGFNEVEGAHPFTAILPQPRFVRGARNGVGPISSTRLAAAIGEIYDAVLSDDGLADIPAILAGTIGATTGVLGTHSPATGMSAVAHNIPEGAIRQALDYYLWINPLSQAALAAPHLQAARGADIFPESVYRETEFCADFARPLDTVEVIGAIVPIAGGVISEVCLHRPRLHRRFDDRDVARVQHLLPHLQRALQIGRRLGTHGTAVAALDVLDVGVVVVAPAGNAIFVNVAGEAIAREVGLRLDGHGPRTTRSADTLRLSALLADVAGGGSGGGIVLAGDDGPTAYVLVAPLAPRFDLAPGHALLTIRRSDTRPSVDAEVLRQLFELTRAEARLALALAGGDGLRELAGRWSLSEHTLRSQLAGALRKTDTRNQTGLVRLVMLLASGAANGAQAMPNSIS